MKIRVRVKPGSRRGSSLTVEKDGTLIICVKERAEDGKANEAVVKLVAKQYGVSVSRIRLTRGSSSRQKVFQIE